MADHPVKPSWWELHLRKARGEVLSAAEQMRYDAEIAAQDNAANPALAALKQLREELKASALENAALRQRVTELEGTIREAEQALSKEVRESLGVGD